MRTRERALSADEKITIGEIVDRFIADRELSGKQAQKYRYQWQSMKETFEGLQPEDLKTIRIVKEQERTICHEYAVKRQEMGRRRATIWSELVLLRTAMNWAEKEHIIEKAPPVFIPKEYKSRNPNLTIEDVLVIIDSAVEHHVKLIFTIALFTGARKGAILDLTWDQVDFEMNMIHFEPEADIDSEDDDILDSGHMKGRAHIDMHPDLRVVLAEVKQAAQTDHVIEYLGNPVKDAKRGIKAAIDRAKMHLPHLRNKRFIGVHALRHAFATHAADMGVEIRVIQKALGHDDEDTTRKTYAKHSSGYTLPAASAVADKIGTRKLIEKRD